VVRSKVVVQRDRCRSRRWPWRRNLRLTGCATSLDPREHIAAVVEPPAPSSSSRAAARGCRPLPQGQALHSCSRERVGDVEDVVSELGVTAWPIGELLAGLSSGIEAKQSLWPPAG